MSQTWKCIPGKSGCTSFSLFCKFHIQNAIGEIGYFCYWKYPSNVTVSTWPTHPLTWMRLLHVRVYKNRTFVKFVFPRLCNQTWQMWYPFALVIFYTSKSGIFRCQKYPIDCAMLSQQYCHVVWIRLNQIGNRGMHTSFLL